MAKHNQSSLGKMISIMSRVYQQYMSERIAPLGLNMTSLAVLMGLHADPGLSLNEFSKVKRINKALLSKTLKSMEADGLVKIIPDNNHKQRFQLFLTDQAKALAPKCRKLLSSYEEKALANLTDEEKEIFINLLDKVYRTVAASHNGQRPRRA